jgi:hypothetical protein
VSARRAAIRLWVVGSVVWIAFWLWNYGAKCIHTSKGALFCPDASGDALLRTDYLHAAGLIFGPPVLCLIAGLLLLWAIRAGQYPPDSK